MSSASDCKCAVCGKEFSRLCKKQYKFVRTHNNTRLYFCCYTCMKKFDESNPPKRNLVIENRRKNWEIK